jgi:predicted alpha/beta superfamily hydrolase
MKKLVPITLLFFINQVCAQYHTTVRKVYSTNVKDSFEIYISEPEERLAGNYDEVIYYLDANLKSGKLLRQLVEDDKVKFRKKFLYVGIGHIGNFHQLRRRDFILPFIQNGDTIPRSAEYGQTEKFYQFLQSELIPSIDANYPNEARRSILGHSLGGLFAVYCLFRNEGLFDKYFALSPALWIDHFRIFQFDRIKDRPVKGSYLFLAAGSRENFNNILNGFHRMEEYVAEKKYSGFNFDRHIYYGTHNSYLKTDISRILYEKVLRQ